MKRLVNFFLGCLFAVNANAALESMSARDDLIERLSFVNSMSADFTQSVTEQRRIIQKTNGHLHLQRSDKFRWQAEAPSRQLIVSNGHHLWVYDEDLEQVTIKKLGQNNQNIPILLLNGYEKTLKKAYLVSVKSENKVDTFHLVPNDLEKNAYEWINLSYQKNKLKELVLKDKLGQITTLTLSKVLLNIELKPALFIFTPPKGVDVVE